MKKLFRFATLLMAVVAASLSACKEVPEAPIPVDPFEKASVEVKLVGADVNAATLSVNAEVVSVVAYVIKPVEGENVIPTAEEIFAQGTMIALEKEGATQVTIRNLEAETDYITYWAGRISSDKVWSEVKEFGFTTAAEPIVPELKVRFKDVAATTAEFGVYAENVSRIAYLVKPAAEAEGQQAPNVQIIFATGKIQSLENGENTLTVKALSPNSEYVVYIAGEVAVVEEYMDEIIVMDGIKTTDFAEDITVRDINYRGFVVDVKVSPRVKEQNHAIKWATVSLYTYNGRGGGHGGDGMSMNLHDTVWGGVNIFNESRSLIVDETHGYVWNDSAEPDIFYDAPVPGQPQVVVMGEYRRGEHWGGWGYGYYIPMFDENAYYEDQQNSASPLDEAPYWEGLYHRLFVQIQKPEPLPEEFIQVEINAEPDDAQIKVSADKSIKQVAIMIMSDLEHGIASNAIGQEHMQWFATSLEAMYGGVTMIVNPYDAERGFNGSIQTALSEYFYDIPRDSKYWVDVVGLRGDFNGDGYLDGHEQVYKHFEFYLPKPTKPAPELIVTPLESTSPYEVNFNVKCPTKDAESGKVIANYEKEWLMAGMSAQEIVYNYGMEFSSVELARINSDEGLTINYTSRPNEKTYLAAMVANDEGTETYSDVVIARSLVEPAAERVESELFESLKGDWTATTTIYYMVYNSDTEQYEPMTEPSTSIITIGDFEYPETLTEDVYETFQRHGVSREMADLYYAEFKAAAKTFNDNTRAQNRILMNGFNFADALVPYYQYADPYSLFISDTYNGFTSEMPIYDFGPKWFLEVAADGTVTAPFNVNYFTPMSSWYAMDGAIYESHLIAYDYVNKLPVGYMGDENGNIINGHFPVEISEDGNTITVKPFEYSGSNFYPNSAIYYGSGMYNVNVALIEDIVLTRNTAATAAPAKAARRSVGAVKKEMVETNQRIAPPARPASRGAIGPKVEFKKVEGPKHYTEQQRRDMWIESRRK
ncbi:MAG: hypothetical protein II323_04940 [Tidjanibacter sp.]|nr:hypothetical protein [Tidjanibacter sp.]